MFERYTDDARRVIFFARYEASRLGSPVLETEHLWLGLLRQNKRLMKRLAPQVTVDSVSRSLISPAPNAARISMTVDLPLSDATHSVFSAAEAEADRIGQRYITSESLIVALLRETTAAA